MKKCFFMPVAAAVFLAAAVSCETDMIGIPCGDSSPGDIPDSGPTLYLNCLNAPENTVSIILTEGNGFVAENIFLTSDNPLPDTRMISVYADESLVSDYSGTSGTACKILPEMFYEFRNNGTVEFPEGRQKSGYCSLTIRAASPSGDLLAPGRYLLPVRAMSPWSTVRRDVLYFDVTVREKYSGSADLYKGDDIFMVFYVNTSEFDPRLACDFYMDKTDNGKRVWYAGVGNIVNLRKSTVGFDMASGKVSVELSPDMRYLLENYETYILPLQETGRKVCLCIEGGGKGIGFCNMTDSQIDEFARNTARIVETYRLDGVNLWDTGSNYGTDGVPGPNTTSYPKLIRRLREAIGEYRYLTLTDYGEPTEYFHDIEATDGIAVGQYLDYAWSGYNSKDEPVQVIDPYHQGAPGVSVLHPRKPIPGLNPKRYGCTNAYWHAGMGAGPYADLQKWEKGGYRQNGIFVFEDIRSLIQDEYEGGTWNPTNFMLNLARATNSNISYQIDPTKLRGPSSGYDKWVKDW